MTTGQRPRVATSLQGKGRVCFTCHVGPPLEHSVAVTAPCLGVVDARVVGGRGQMQSQ